MNSMTIKIYILTIFIFFQSFLATTTAEQVVVAVANNFLETLHEIVARFEEEKGHRVILSAGSSGKLYAQIKNGAPFDVFFSADIMRPRLLENGGLAVQGSRFTYAVGRLTLWSSDNRKLGERAAAVLSNNKFEHLAIANPRTAPYGRAAKEVLIALGLWNQVRAKIVQGENISQTFQFVFSKNACLGIVSISQALTSKVKGYGKRWDIPLHLYSPLEQQTVLLLKGKNNRAAIDLLGYVKGGTAQMIIKQFGYGLE